MGETRPKFDILELNREPVQNVVFDLRGHHDLPGLRHLMDTGCDIDPVSENFAPFDDDIGQVHPDAQCNPPIG